METINTYIYSNNWKHRAAASMAYGMIAYNGVRVFALKIEFIVQYVFSFLSYSYIIILLSRLLYLFIIF